MKPAPCLRGPHARGFTLIEVLVALVIVAFGIGALLTTLTSAADNVSYLRDKSIAEWIALNHLAELRLSRARPQVGDADGELDYAGSRWRWHQNIADQGIADLFRIDVEVSRAGSAPLATVVGFIGATVGAPSAFDPDWSLASAPTLTGDEAARQREPVQ